MNDSFLSTKPTINQSFQQIDSLNPALNEEEQNFINQRLKSNQNQSEYHEVQELSLALKTQQIFIEARNQKNIQECFNDMSKQLKNPKHKELVNLYKYFLFQIHQFAQQKQPSQQQNNQLIHKTLQMYYIVKKKTNYIRIHHYEIFQQQKESNRHYIDSLQDSLQQKAAKYSNHDYKNMSLQKLFQVQRNLLPPDYISRPIKRKNTLKEQEQVDMQDNKNVSRQSKQINQKINNKSTSINQKSKKHKKTISNTVQKNTLSHDKILKYKNLSQKKAQYEMKFYKPITLVWKSKDQINYNKRKESKKN